jgi:selenocysteine-specific elongation factor
MHTIYSDKAIELILQDMKSDSRADENNGRWFKPDDISRIEESIVSSVEDYLTEFPHREGVTAKHIADSAKVASNALETVIDLLLHKQVLVKNKNLYNLPGREISISGKLKTLADELENQLKETGFAPPLIKELVGSDSNLKEALDFLINSGKVVKINPILVFHADSWRGIIDSIKQIFQTSETMSVASLREKLGSSRKYIMPILEETDRREITRREGDVRHKGERFDEN